MDKWIDRLGFWGCMLVMVCFCGVLAVVMNVMKKTEREIVEIEAVYAPLDSLTAPAVAMDSLSVSDTNDAMLEKEQGKISE